MKATALDERTVGADQPTPEEVRALAGDGYALLVNLREADELEPADAQALAEEAGLAYRRIPVTGTGFGAEDARSLRAALDAVPEGRVLIYCSTGSRVAALWAAMHALEAGMEADAAVALAQRSGDVRPGALQRLREVLGNERG